MIAAALHALMQPEKCQLDSKDHDDLLFWLHKNLHIVKRRLKQGLTVQTHKVIKGSAS